MTVGNEPRGRRVYQRESEPVQLYVEGQWVEGFAGESVAAAMLVQGFTNNRWTSAHGEPRSAFCGMGACFDCLVYVHGVGSVRSCMTACSDGAVIDRPGGRKLGET